MAGYQRLASVVGFAATVGIGLSSFAAAADRAVYVERQQLVCIAEHAEAYLALDKDPMVIVVDACPSMGEAHFEIVGPLQDSLTIQHSEGLPSTPPQIFATPLLIVTKAQLTCLAEGYASLKPTQSTDGMEVVRLDGLDCM